MRAKNYDDRAHAWPRSMTKSSAFFWPRRLMQKILFCHWGPGGFIFT